MGLVIHRHAWWIFGVRTLSVEPAICSNTHCRLTSSRPPTRLEDNPVTPSAPAHRHTTGINRRELLQIGSSALLGISLPSLLAGRAEATAASRAAGRAA